MISFDIIDLTQYEFEIRRRAFIRAMQRGVTPGMIEATLKGGTIKHFGKNDVKLYRKYKNFTVICVDEIIGTKIKIVAIEIKR
ncbi:hypothetical protein JXA85_01410 [Candidatus Woesearchaeota archaeon]|nr:hypothetical protein [Candidatus Woesearchaeota archaeon]